MSSIREILKRIMQPKGWQVLLGTCLIVALMLYAFVFGNPPEWIAYICYIVSAYCFFADCVWFVKNGRSWKRKVTELINRNRYVARYLSDVAYKTVVSAYMSLAVNMVYVVMNLFTGAYYKSLWSLTLAVYYLLLTVMRFLLLKNTRIDELGKDMHAEYKKYRTSAYVLLLMNFALAGIVALAITYNNGFTYAGYLIYIMAMYAFYNIISAIVSLVKYRKIGSPVLSAAKVISFSSALISMLSLELAMLSSFGEADDAMFRSRMIGITGLGISAVFIATSCYMIRRAGNK